MKHNCRNYGLKSELYLGCFQQLEWSVIVMVIVQTTSLMELVWDSLAASASVQWRRCITWKQQDLSWSGRLVAFLQMKVDSCRCASISKRKFYRQ
jgi:hypothetical protein